MKIRKKTLFMMAILAILTVFPSCKASAYEITELPLDYSIIEKVIIETPRRNARINTHVELVQGEEGGITGWIHSYSMKGRTLTIKPGGDLEMTMPRENSLKDIDIAIASGSILIEGFDTLDRIDTSSASGDISLENLGIVETINSDSTNGNLTVEGRKVGKADLNTISGDILFSGTAESLEFSGISGNMSILTGESVDVSFDTLTGRRDYESRKGAEMKLKASSISGSLSVKTR